MFLANNLVQEELDKACITFWSIWTDRNAVRTSLDIMQWPIRCEWIVDYWLQTRAKLQANDSSSIIGTSEATSGNLGLIHVYTDAAVNKNVMGFGFGAAIIGEDGVFIGAQGLMAPISFLQLAAEVRALLYGLQFLQRLHIMEVSVFADSLHAIMMVKGEQLPSPDVYHWIMQIQEMIKSFRSLSFHHIPRLRTDGLIAWLKMLYLTKDRLCG